MNPVEQVKEMPHIQIGGHYPDGRPMVKCCVNLRCKSLYYSGVERPGLLHLSNVMTYWCVDTQETIGCDGKEASPLHCQPGRKCCEM
ncbi:hypothetical protein HY256_04325 [Candidatus Sumerlaeota bacterium]|nr:hypothetical protein [Candidatus Sumerlaeota bacterium]